MKDKIKAFLFLFALCALGTGLHAQQASAHAVPVEYRPQNSSVVEEVPQEISIKFSERVEEKISGLEVLGPEGEVVNAEEAWVDEKDPHVFKAKINNAGEGVYTISWQVVSADDGHFSKGAGVFKVDKEGGVFNASSGQVQIQHLTTLPEATLIWIELVGQAFILGGLILLMFFWKPIKKTLSKEEVRKFNKRFTAFIVLGALLVVLGSFSHVVLKTFDLQQINPGSFASVFDDYSSSVAGKHGMYRGFLGLLFLAGFIGFRKDLLSSGKSKWKILLLIAIYGAVVLSRTRVSHAAASHIAPNMSIFFNFTHLVFKELWIGLVGAFSILFMPIILKGKDEKEKVLRFVKLSKFLSIAAGIIGVTGAYIIWLHLKDPANAFSTEWGSRFMLLNIFAVVFLLVRFFHQFLIERYALVKKSFSRLLGVTIPLEALMGTALLFLTSFMIITTPPYVLESYSFEQTDVKNGITSTLEIHPYESSTFLITWKDESGEPVRIEEVSITATNTEKNIGPILVSADKRFENGFAIPVELLTPPGDWKISIVAKPYSGYDINNTFSLNYPDDVTATATSSSDRSFGGFDLFVIASVVITMAGGYLLYAYSSRTERFIENFPNADSGSLNQKTGNMSMKKVGAGCFLLFALTSLLLMQANTSFLKTDFEKECEENGHFWIQSAPLHNGETLSPNTFTGCTLDVGLYHFVDYDEYSYFLRRADSKAVLIYNPEDPVAGEETEITVSLNKIEDGRVTGPTQELTLSHDRILHMIIIGEDLTTFAHTHSEDIGPITDQMKEDGEFPFRFTFPKAGTYKVLVDYAVRGSYFYEDFTVEVSGTPEIDPVNADFYRTREFEGYEVSLDLPKKVKAGEELQGTYLIKKNGKEVKNLEPYLAASMHIAAIDQNLGRFQHTHGEIYLPGSAIFQKLASGYVRYHSHFTPDSFGPRVQFGVGEPFILERPGVYKLFGEFKHEGKVVVTEFFVEVE